jgi:glycine/D-amino acid oxidase-like deaminating enzyme
MSAGRVFAHVGQPLDRDEYDVVVIGGGRMGLALAFALLDLAPEAGVLIVERDGIPSEDGATIVSRGVWTAQDLPPAWAARAEWTRRIWLDPARHTGVNRPHDPRFRPTGVLRLSERAPEEHDLTPEDALARLPQDAAAQLHGLVDLRRVGSARWDERGGHGSATSVALAFGYGAVRRGADLLLSTEGRLVSGGVEVRRLDITNRMEIVVAETRLVRAGHVVVAAGHAGPRLLEDDLGVIGPHGRAWVQFPRVAVPPAEGLPVVSFAGLTVRPGAGFLRVLPRVRGADPHDFVPVAGRLGGVPTGTRREILEELLGALEDWPVLAEGALNLGRVLGDVEGAWEARPAGGWPLHEEVAPGVSLLLGGPRSDLVGPAVALDLAATLTRAAHRPWEADPTDG